MLPVTPLSSMQQLHRSLACWCVSHMHPISASSSLISKNGEFFRILCLPVRSNSVGIKPFQRRVFSCPVAGRKETDMDDKADHGVLTRPARSRANGLGIQNLENSSPEVPSVSPDVALTRPQGWISTMEKRKQIFCNRSLNMKSIVAVGFDMDYTLAQYKAETFETLAYTGTIKKLVYNLGYPQELLDWTFDWRYMVRGLVLDKKRGNILKMDRHKYVKVAYHGFTQLSREDRALTYGNGFSRESFDEPDYALIDTLFSLAEAYLFAQLVEFTEAHPGKMHLGTDFAQMYSDVRAAVDLCHRDGTLKEAVAGDPRRYIHEDAKILPMFKMLRDSGRLTFLVTNSLWDYTNVVMNYLFGKSGTSDGIPRDYDWLSYFDLVITGSAKPAFFKDGYSAPLFGVGIKTGMLQNTDNGSPQAQIGRMATEVPVVPDALQTKGYKVFQGFPVRVCLSKTVVIQGGGVTHLHKLLSIEASAQVMYVGDHIYGDILQSKKALGWRTMLVVPELDRELELLQSTAGIHKEVQRLRQLRDALEDALQRLEWDFKHEDSSEVRSAILTALQTTQRQRDSVREQHRRAQRECHHKFHTIWGQLMKTGYQNSRFAHQVERFACLYTSHVTNLCHYSPDKCYRTSEDYMPHEMDVYSP